MPLPDRDSLVTLQTQLVQQEKQTVLALGMLQGQLQLIARMLAEDAAPLSTDSEENENGE